MQRMDKIVIVIGALLLAWGLAACGTIEIDVANENQEADDVADSVDSGTANPENASPATTATRTAEVEARATPSRSAEAQEADPTPRADVRVAPADWQRFYDDGLWHRIVAPAGHDSDDRPASETGLFKRRISGGNRRGTGLRGQGDARGRWAIWPDRSPTYPGS